MSLTDVSFTHQTFDGFRNLLNLLQHKYLFRLKIKYKQSRGYVPKVHSYLKSNSDNVFAFEPTGEDSLKYCMTAFGSGVNSGDLIVIAEQDLSIVYKV